MTDSNQIQQAITIVEKIIDGCVNIESNSDIHNDAKKLSRFVQKDCRLALTKLRQAIENESRIVKECKETMADLEQAEKREWVGLTDEERRYYNDRLSGSGVAEEIEAKLKEKNT